MPTTGPCDTATALTHAHTHTTTHKSTQSAVAATAAAGAAAATSQSREADDGGLGGAAHTAGVAVPVARAAHPVVIVGRYADTHTHAHAHTHTYRHTHTHTDQPPLG